MIVIRKETDLPSTEILLPYSLSRNDSQVIKRVIVHFGIWQWEFNVTYRKDEKQEIGFSAEVEIPFDIPADLSYQVKLVGRHLYLGPVVGFMGYHHKKNMAPNSLDKYLKYLRLLDENGLVFICAADGINIEDRTMEGYYYNSKNETPWKHGVFPLPAALYRKVEIPDSVYSDLVNIMGEEIFNSYFFDKWETWDWLSSDPLLRSHIPYTTVFSSLHLLDDMLSSYGSVYLKKIDGKKSMGLLKVSLENQGYAVMDLKGKVEVVPVEKAEEFFKEVIKHGFIIQQEIKVPRYERRHFDIRAILQKDRSGQWKCNAMITKFGKPDGISTIVADSGFALTGEKVLQEVFGLDKKDTFKKLEEINTLCVEACKALERCGGHYADLGIDLVIDENQKVWILEINKLHDHTMPLYVLKDRDLYQKVLSAPLEYAIARAGF